MFFILCLLIAASTTLLRAERYVVVLSMDGFRSDYNNKASTPTFDSIAQVGVKSGFRPCFPSSTFPNHYSMATGLYPDHHGLVANKFYDASLDKVYCKGDPDPRFFGGEPIWNTARNQGVKSAVYFWVGSEYPINSQQPNIWKPYDKQTLFTSRADSVISWLSLPEPERPRLVMWYVEEPDGISHKATPDSPQTLRKVEQLDSMLSRFLSKARELDIYADIDFIVVSDHGMATYTPERSVNLNDYLPIDSFKYVFAGVPTLLYPNSGYTEKAYSILKTVPHVDVWRKDEIPAKFHYGTNHRVPDLLVVPNIGTKIYFSEHPSIDAGGDHGYDNYTLQMEGIFYAFGPSFKEGYQVEVMENINLYLILSRILGLKPAPGDGDPVIINQLFKE